MTGAQGETCHTFLVEHALHFAHPHRDTAIGVLLDCGIYGHIGAGAVVLRPVELNASRNPGTCKTHKSGLDHVVVVDEVALLYLVVSHLHTAAKLGQNHHFDILVFDIYGIVLLIYLLVGHRLDYRVGINYTA